MLDLKNQVFTVVKQEQNGKTVETLKPSNGLQVPGQTGVLRLTIKNVASKSLKNIRPVQPLNASQQYLAGSASTLYPVEFSFDHGQTFFQEPITRTVAVQENGKTVQKKVTVKPSEYTDVRWNIPELKPGESQVLDLSYKVR